MIIDLGLTDYETSYKTQKEFVRQRKFGEIEDSLIITEHHPVFTIGRTGKKENLLVSEEILAVRGIKVFCVDRGGDITFHGPGQIVLYPIINLKAGCADLHGYLRRLEAMVISFLNAYSVKGETLSGKTGVWVEGKKLSFIGIGVTSWVTYHGLSVNIDVDLSFFSMMNPCGLKNIEVTSLSVVLNNTISMRDAKDKMVKHFTDIFDIRGPTREKHLAAVA